MDSEKKRWQAHVTATVFSILIFGFTVATMLTPDLEFSETEKRVVYPYIWIYSSYDIYTHRGVFRNRKPRFGRDAGSENK